MSTEAAKAARVSIVKDTATPDTARIAQMVHEVLALLGGMEQFVKKGDTVTIKGNFFAPYPPPVIVDRRVVAALIREAYAAGASSVTLCEAVSVGTKQGRNTTTSDVLDEMGIRAAAQEAGARVLCLEDDQRITVQVPGARSLGVMEYPRSMYDCDVLINLPCLKTHTMTMVTLGIKNYQGILTDSQKYYAHRDDLEQKLVDIQKVRKTQLTLIDGITAMEGNGAGESGTPHPMNMLIASADTVAADAVAAACMGIEDVLDVTAIRLAQHDGIGVADLSAIEVVGTTIAEAKEKFLLPITYTKPQDRYLTGMFPNVDVYIGGACKMCWLMAGGFARTLARFAPRRFAIFAGVDPKFAGNLNCPLDHVIMLGDCACSATGSVKELHNQMLLEKSGLLAPGCPPYRPASARLEQYLVDRGMVTREQLEMQHKAAIKKTYDYYKTIDPTWVPKSEESQN